MDEAAKEARVVAPHESAKTAWDATQANARSAETNRLIAEAAAAGTEPALAVTDSRKVAMTLSASNGPWTQAAATTALGGTDDQVMEFVRTGITTAAGQDDRLTLQNLAATGTANFKKAANSALAGSDADVRNFLQDKDYPQRYVDDRIAVNQVLAAAQQSGGTAVVSSAQKALDAGTDQALRDFLGAGQYPAAATDQRIKVNQLMADPNAGPELKADAQAALDGPPAFLSQFLATIQYTATQHDADLASHDAEMLGLLKQAQEIATQASKNADDAQVAAAHARGSAKDATDAANRAAADAAAAGNYAAQAHNSALVAESAAQRAADSAATARTAAAAADVSARQAGQSAEWAVASANQASGFARDAWDSAQRAYDAARAAGQSAQQAHAAAGDAYKTAVDKIDAAKAQALLEQASYCKGLHPNGGADYDNCIHLISQPLDQRLGEAMSNAEVCQGMQQASLQLGGSTGVVNQNFQNCLQDVLDPNFQGNRTMELTLPALQELLTLVDGFANILLGAQAVADCLFSGLCVGLAAAAVAGGGAGLRALGDTFAEWMSRAAISDAAFLADRAATVAVDALVDAEALDGLLADDAFKVFSEGNGALGACATPNSFTGDTPVLLAGGGQKPIKDVGVGDTVLATDPTADLTQPRKVTQLITGQGVKHLVDVGVEGSVVQATDNHPFWVTDTRSWMDAGALRVGEHLRTPDGHTAVVTSLRPHTETLKIYNLSVDALHSYYVEAGRTPVLVHNTNPLCGLGGFKIGISAEEITEINADLGGKFLINGSPANLLINLERYDSFWEKLAVVIRDIVDGHMFNDANKRTAFAAAEELMTRNNIMSGPTAPELWRIIDAVGDSTEAMHTSDIEKIASMLRGY